MKNSHTTPPGLGLELQHWEEDHHNVVSLDFVKICVAELVFTVTGRLWGGELYILCREIRVGGEGENLAVCRQTHAYSNTSERSTEKHTNDWINKIYKVFMPSVFPGTRIQTHTHTHSIVQTLTHHTYSRTHANVRAHTDTHKHTCTHRHNTAAS